MTTPHPDSTRLEPDNAWVADLMRSTPDATIVLDEDLNFVWGNAAAERLVGQKADDAVGTPGLDYLHPDDLSTAVLSVGTMVGKLVGTPLELRIRTHDGWRLCEVVGSDLGGMLLLSIRDLTERRRWDIAHDSDEKFRTLLRNAPVLTMLIDENGVVQTMTASVPRLLGFDQSIVESRPFSSLVDHREVDDVEAAILSAASADADDRDPVHFDATLRTREGAPVPHHFSIVNLLDDPTVGGLVLSGHDVSDLVAVQADLRSANSLLEAALESTADGILVVNTDGEIVDFNRRFAEMWRIPREILDAGDDNAAIGFVLDQLVAPEEFVAKVEELYARPKAES